MVYIGAPPQQFVIPVTLAADREFTINRVDATNNPVNWAATVTLAIDITKGNPTIITATVTGNQAVILIPSAMCDQVTNFTAWRMFMDTSGLTTPIAVGKFERDDGGA
jgi:hypothetical protein